MSVPKIGFLGFSREHKEALQFFARMAGITVCPSTNQNLDYLCVGATADPKHLKRQDACVLTETEFLLLKDSAVHEVSVEKTHKKVS